MAQDKCCAASWRSHASIAPLPWARVVVPAVLQKECQSSDSCCTPWSSTRGAAHAKLPRASLLERCASNSQEKSIKGLQHAKRKACSHYLKTSDFKYCSFEVVHFLPLATQIRQVMCAALLQGLSSWRAFWLQHASALFSDTDCYVPLLDSRATFSRSSTATPRLKNTTNVQTQRLHRSQHPSDLQSLTMSRMK